MRLYKEEEGREQCQKMVPTMCHMPRQGITCPSFLACQHLFEGGQAIFWLRHLNIRQVMSQATQAVNYEPT